MSGFRRRSATGTSLNQIFRENLKYILAVLLVWAITFPFILQNNDTILADLTLKYNRLGGYPNVRVAHQLIGKGDAILEGRRDDNSDFFGRITSFFTNQDDPKSNILPLDLTVMEKACLYYRSKEHIESVFLEPTWREKATEWGSPLFRKYQTLESEKIALGPNPKDYWNSHIEFVLSALDYYKKALRFSGSEFQIPKKIESVAWAVCRPAEILLAYKTYMLESEDLVIQTLKNENKLPSDLTDAQIQSIAMSAIKKNAFPEINPNDYLESLLRQILLTGMKTFSPKEMDVVYERILYFVAQDEKVYLKYKQRRGDLYYQLAATEPIYYAKAISEFTDASNITLAMEDETANLPALLVHQFDSILSTAKCYSKMNENAKALKVIDSLSPKLRNVDERSVGGVKKDVLNDYRETKRIVLRKLKRYEEADEIPQDK